MQLPQISCFGWHSGAFAQSGSAQSTRPSPSLSMPSLHCSGPQPGTSVWAQTPPVQVSVVQALPSSQSAAVVHGTQPGMVAWAHAPASQVSVVQASVSLQSAAVVQGTQPEVVACTQAPASQLSVV